ncbi:MAG: sulfite exporter TauE/SafE family protein [Actinomycetia bacterium]|nr:sulfite exporter TauE/SafE family protein [Actinomycetes bacterium]
MIEGLASAEFVALAVAVFVGATVQGVVGLGIGLVFAPVAGLIEPTLLPGVALWMALVMPVLTLFRDIDHADWRGLVWAVPARIPGTAVGVAVVVLASTRVIGVAVGTMVLIAIALSVHALDMRVSRASLLGAGFVSGVTGTATSIGGPPIALVYQHREPSQVRATLGVYFVLGAAFSLIGLTVAGDLTRHDILVALALLPFLLLGFASAMRLRGRVPVHRVRDAMLAVCAASALALVVRNLVG